MIIWKKTLNHISTVGSMWNLVTNGWVVSEESWFYTCKQLSGREYNKNKQDGSHLSFPIRMILATIDLQVTSILSMNFESIAFSDFQDGRHGCNLGFPIATSWATFYLQVIPMLPTKFRVSWSFSSEGEGKNRFSRCPTSWISDWNIFSYFYIYKSSRCFLPIFKSSGPLV